MPCQPPMRMGSSAALGKSLWAPVQNAPTRCARRPGLAPGRYSFALTLNGRDFHAGTGAAAAFSYTAELYAVEPT